MKASLSRLLVALCLTSACAHRGQNAAFFTEGGLRTAEQGWDEHYNQVASECETKFEPQTPEMEICFGETYDIDAKVAKVVEAAVGLLRSYWIARKQGEDPNWWELQREILKLVSDLPPEALAYFDKLKQEIPR